MRTKKEVSPNATHLTIDQVAERLGMSRRFIEQGIKSGEMKACKLGRVYRIPITELKKFEFDQAVWEVYKYSPTRKDINLPTWNVKFPSSNGCRRAAELSRRISKFSQVFNVDERNMFSVIAENFMEAAQRLESYTVETTVRTKFKKKEI